MLNEVKHLGQESRGWALLRNVFPVRCPDPSLPLRMTAIM